MSKAIEITKEIWDGVATVAKFVCSICGFPILLVTFLNNCGANLDKLDDPSRTVYRERHVS